MRQTIRILSASASVLLSGCLATQSQLKHASDQQSAQLATTRAQLNSERAERIASDAPSQGYAPQVAPLDDHIGKLPTEGAVAIIAASYEGQPPDNARQFASPWSAGGTRRSGASGNARWMRDWWPTNRFAH